MSSWSPDCIGTKDIREGTHHTTLRCFVARCCDLLQHDRVLIRKLDRGLKPSPDAPAERHPLPQGARAIRKIV
jgi:hypothetical protein